MRILIFIAHPAKVYFFKNFYYSMINKNHKVIFAVVDKEISVELINLFKMPYRLIGKNKRSLFGKVIQLFLREIKLLLLSISFKPNVIIGDESPEPAHVSFLIKKPYIAFADTEHAKLTWKITKPFITKVITPRQFLNNLGKKQIRIDGFKELAYLHPNYFIPNPKIFEYLNINSNEKFVFLRFISWGAQHDIGHKGISDKIKIKAVNEFRKYAKVFISAEGYLPEELEKYRINISIEMIHHVLYYAALYFGESGTMATESAILGTPTVRVSTIAKLLGNTKELSEKYNLLYFYDDDNEGLNKALELLKNNNSKQEWQNRVQKLLKEKIDVTQFLVDFITNKVNYE